MLRLQDVFKKTAKHLNTPSGHHTWSFSHHALFHFFRLLNRPKWKEFEETTLCHYGKLAFANFPFGASLKIDKIVRPENVWTNISCQICNCRIGITESPNPHGILRKRPKAARKSLGNGASITISCWLKSVDDDHHYHNNIIVIINFKKLRKHDNTIGKGNKSYIKNESHHHQHHHQQQQQQQQEQQHHDDDDTTGRDIQTNKEGHTATTEGKQRHQPTTSTTTTAIWFFLLLRYAWHVITAYNGCWCHHLGTRANRAPYMSHLCV